MKEIRAGGEPSALFIPARSALELLPSSALSSALHIYNTAFFDRFQPLKHAFRALFARKSNLFFKKMLLFLPFFSVFCMHLTNIPFYYFQSHRGRTLPPGKRCTLLFQSLGAPVNVSKTRVKISDVGAHVRLYEAFTTAAKTPKQTRAGRSSAARIRRSEA